MPRPNLAAVKAAAIDGRAQNIYYRQGQLKKLHQSLVVEAATIHAAIVADSNVSQLEAQVEYTLALNALRERYAELDPGHDLEKEYRIAQRKNAGDASVGMGIAIIRPTRHTFFYSTVVPLSSALAAGNCVIIQLEDSTRETSRVLQSVLTAALDPDSYTVSDTTPIDDSLIPLAVQVMQDGAAANGVQLRSTPTAITVAIVDRGANFDEAAKAIISARFGFGGQSPYAPDLVLVNEFVKKDLLQALVQQTVAAGSPVLANGRLEKPKLRENGFKSVMGELQRTCSGEVHIVTEDSRGAILDHAKRSAELLASKIDEPVLIVHGIKSLDDGIDFLTANATTLLAAYHFGSPETGKYLSQFVSAQVTFINHIPTEMLVGPAAPVGYPVQPSTRYPAQLFTKPTPTYINQEPESQLLDKASRATSMAERAAALRTISAKALAALPEVRRRKQMTASFGFFEQAFILHLGLASIATVSTVVGGLWWFTSARGWQAWR